VCVGWRGLTDFRPDLISSLFLCHRPVYFVVDMLCCCCSECCGFWIFVYCHSESEKSLGIYDFVHFVSVNWFELFAICCLCRVRLSKNVVHQRGKKPIYVLRERERDCGTEYGVCELMWSFVYQNISIINNYLQ